MVSIQLAPTLTNVSSSRETFLNHRAATRAFLRGIGRVHRHGNLAKFYPKILQPFPKLIPTRIVNRLGETVVSHQILYPQIYALRAGFANVGYQIVRLDYATRQSLGVFYALRRRLRQHVADLF